MTAIALVHRNVKCWLIKVVKYPCSGAISTTCKSTTVTTLSKHRLEAVYVSSSHLSCWIAEASFTLPAAVKVRASTSPLPAGMTLAQPLSFLETSYLSPMCQQSPLWPCVSERQRTLLACPSRHFSTKAHTIRSSTQVCGGRENSFAWSLCQFNAFFVYNMEYSYGWSRYTFQNAERVSNGEAPASLCFQEWFLPRTKTVQKVAEIQFVLMTSSGLVCLSFGQRFCRATTTTREVLNIF